MTTFAALDFETADHGRDSACAVGLVRVEGSQVVRSEAVLIRPPRREFVWTHVHGIRWEDVRGAEPFAAVWPRLLPLLDGCTRIAAHNATFDRSVLAACCSAAGLTPPALPWVCTLEMARKRWAKPHKNTLPDVCGRLGIDLKAHHHAGADAEACAKVLIALEELDHLEAHHADHSNGGRRAVRAAAAQLPVPGGVGGPAGHGAAGGVCHPDGHPGRAGGELHPAPDAAGADRSSGGLRPDGGVPAPVVRDAAGHADRVRGIAADRGVTCETLIDVCHGLGVLHHLEAWVREWAAGWDRRRAGGGPCRMCGRPTGYMTVWTCSGCVGGEGAGDRTRAEAGVA